MNRTLHSLLLLLLLLGLSAPSAFAAPGDAAPDFGDDDDDDDDDDDEEEDSGPVFDDEETDAAEEDSAEEPSEDADESTDDGESDDSGDDYDPLEGLNLPPSGEEDSGSAASEDDSEAADEDEQGDGDGDEVASGRSSRDERRQARLEKRKRIVKVIQKKFFLKYRRFELTPHIGYVGNDNFITRLHLGVAGTYHINDILGIELTVAGMPNLGETDYKPLTRRFQRESEVVPDITRVTFLATLGGAVSPIYGKVELGASRIINYDIYFLAGAGMVNTRDDTAIIKSPCDDLPTVRERKDRTNPTVAENGCWLVDQQHFASYFGGGLRIVFNKWIGVRLDVRNITHIEQAWRNGDIGLEMKHSLVINIGASFFLPPEPRRLN